MSDYALTRADLEKAAALVHAQMPATPQHSWPLLNERAGFDIVVKHENHTPAGAFKIRGGITFMDWLTREHPRIRGIVTATRGNHGQSQARAATAAGLTATVVVPHGNSREKNAAMRAFGAELIEHGQDFDVAKEEAHRLARERDLFFVPPFHPALVPGVATYWHELFTAEPGLDVAYVPIGCGSGICAGILTRDALGLKTRIVGVVSENAQTAKLSAEAGRPVETDSADTFADGMAVRVPVAEALAIYSKGAERIVTVSDDEVAGAVRSYYTDTHNLAEGAGAAPLAAALQERERNQGRRVGVILCGGNIDADKFAAILAGETPTP